MKTYINNSGAYTPIKPDSTMRCPIPSANHGNGNVPPPLINRPLEIITPKGSVQVGRADMCPKCGNRFGVYFYGDQSKEGRPFTKWPLEEGFKKLVKNYFLNREPQAITAYQFEILQGQAARALEPKADENNRQYNLRFKTYIFDAVK